ncbi:hypothetical protein CASFOL_010588 [Castilleja foliolosa]|uniref:F-box domain-containing protein n=1 Tax=Castilleja foliolosa TaxID=1961234 RepID=A0ABD3DTJ6_9LAMI
METRSAKRRKNVLTNKEHHHIHHEDRITDLPDDILHQILSYLPIKSIARTSVLSKRFNNLWFTFPDLDFTTLNTLSITSPPRTTAKHSHYVDQISTLLDNHSDIRVLRFRAFLTFSRLTGLIRLAVRRNVQELDVEVATLDYFNFPRSIINSSTIKTLRLKSWHPGFRLPPIEIMRDGFKSLSVLSLSRPVLHDRPSLVDLFTNSSFPLLKKLHLENCFGMKRLRVECPALEDLSLESCFQLFDLEVCVGKLEKLRVSSCFDTYGFGSRVRIKAPRLRVVVWSYNAVTDECGLMKLDCLHEAFVGFFRLSQEGLSEAKVGSVWNLLTGISGCRSLTLDSQCVEIISKSNRFAGVSLCPFNKLKSLELITSFEKHNNPGLACIFRSSPNIHTIVIKIITNQNVERRQWNKELWQSPSSGEERYWESQTQYLNSFLRHLKVVKIHGFTECANDISLVKFFLKQGKVLQELFLRTSGLSKPRDSLLREKIKSQIMGFSRASSNANIVFQ